MGISTAIDNSAIARVVGIKTKYVDRRAGGVLFLPQRIAVFGQGSSGMSYSTDKHQAESAFDIGTLYGFGSPLHLAVKELMPSNGDGVGTIPVTVYPLDDAGTGVASVGVITPSGTQLTAAQYRITVNNIKSEPFIILPSSNVAATCTAIAVAINAILDMPVTAVASATTVTLTAKWKGLSSNDLHIDIVGTIDGMLMGITQPVGGLVNPDIKDALDKVGNVWETMGLNCLDIDDSDALDKCQTFGEGRWGALVRKPLVIFTGNTKGSVALATAISDARKTDRVNAQLVSPDSTDLPFIVAARQLAKIVVVANNNPPTDYGRQSATGLTAGPDSSQWNYTQRDQAIKKGSSSVVVLDEVVTVADTVTFYHPTGDPLPAYRYVVDIVKLQTIIFNLDYEFAGKKWDGSPLIPDDQATVNPNAKQPKAAIAAAAAIIDSLALNAFISDPAAAKAALRAAINDQNPKRLDMVVSVELVGNTNVISIDLDFGFYFGLLAAA